MATGITENAVNKINESIVNYRQALYNKTVFVINNTKIENAIKGTETEKKLRNATQEIQAMIDNYTDNMRKALENSIANIQKSYQQQDIDSQAFTNLRNKYKS